MEKTPIDFIFIKKKIKTNSKNLCDMGLNAQLLLRPLELVVISTACSCYFCWVSDLFDPTSGTTPFLSRIHDVGNAALTRSISFTVVLHHQPIHQSSLHHYQNIPSLSNKMTRIKSKKG